MNLGVKDGVLGVLKTKKGCKKMDFVAVTMSQQGDIQRWDGETSLE